MCSKVFKMIYANPSNSALVIVVILVFSFCPGDAYQHNKLSSLPMSPLKVPPGQRDYFRTPLRSKRSPFIVAFQVTRPPGLFQLSMKKPVIMGVMSNMTSMMLGSEFARMLSRGLNTQQFFLSSNITSSENPTKKY